MLNRKIIRQSRHPSTSAATRSILVLLLLAGGLLSSDAQAATLKVIRVTETAATLTISGHTGDWWYRYKNHSAKDFGPCTAGGDLIRLSPLGPASQYDVSAFSESTCTTVVASVSIATPFLTSNFLGYSSIKPTAVRLILFNYKTDWWYQGSQNDASCTGPVVGSVSIADLAPETTYTYRTYDKSGCAAADEIGSTTFTTQAAGTTTLTASDITGTTATLTIANHTGAWWFQGNGDGWRCIAVASGETSVDLTGLRQGVWHPYKAYDKDGCRDEDKIASEWWSQLGLYVDLFEGDLTATTATLRIRHYMGAAWWHANQNGGGCEEVAGTMKADLTNLTPNTSYNWRVYSKSGCALADTIASIAFTTLTAPSPPETPSSVSVTRADGSLTASWPAVAGATSYHITYSSDGGASWSSPAANHPSTSITISGVTNSATYIVAVRARNDQGDSGWRNSPSVGPFGTPPPETPSSVSVTRSDGSLTASWPAVAGATSYHITYSSDGGASWSLAAANHSSTSITISGVTNSATYIVAVRARNDQGDSGWRNSPSAGPFGSAAPPETPSSVSVTRSDGSLTASWPAVAGATSYHITYSSDGGASWSLAAFNHSSTSITISNVTNSATYIVAVRARNDQGDSGWRNSPSVGPFGSVAPPETPSSVSVTRSDGSLTASWPAVAGATSYHITYSSDGGVSWSLAALNHSSASITISNVTNSATYIVAVRARNDQGDSGWRNSPAAGPFTPGSSKATVSVPAAFGLADNYPNPFNPSTTIGYALPAESEVRLEVFNIAGQRVRVLLDTHQPAGHYTVEWDTRDAQGQAVASGVYFYRLQASIDAGARPFHDVKRMLLIR